MTFILKRGAQLSARTTFDYGLHQTISEYKRKQQRLRNACIRSDQSLQAGNTNIPVMFIIQKI
jgi:hypothetical protein